MRWNNKKDAVAKEKAMEIEATTSVKQLFFKFVEHLSIHWRKVATMSLLADIERYLCQEFAYFLCSYGNTMAKNGKRAIYAITDIGRHDRCFDIALIKQGVKLGERDLVFALIEAKYATNFQKLPDFGYKTSDNISKNLTKLCGQVLSKIDGDGPLTRNFEIGIRSNKRLVYANMWACFKTSADTSAEQASAEKKKFFKAVHDKAYRSNLSWHGKKKSPLLIPVFDDKLVHLGARKYRITLKAGFWVAAIENEE